MLRVERKAAGARTKGRIPPEARPAATDTRFCSAIPSSINCPGRLSAKPEAEAEPLESLHSTRMSLSSEAS